MVCGSTGADRTTCAIGLARESGAVRFSIGAWMTTLFWPDAPAALDFDRACLRVERSAAQMRAVIVVD